MLQLIFSILSIGSMYALLAVGFSLVYGVLRMSNFSHGCTMMVGAYLAYYLYMWKVPLIFCILLAMLGCGVMSLLIERLALRRIRTNTDDKLFLFVATITVMMMVNTAITVLISSETHGFPSLFSPAGFFLLDAYLSKTSLIAIGISIVVMAVLTYVLRKTRLGIAIRAAAADAKTAQLMGINTNLIVSIVFLIAGLLAGCSGVFMGITYSVYPTMSKQVNKALMATVIGGLGSIGGSVVGAFLLAAIEVIVNYYLGSSYVYIATFIVIVLFLLLRPGGIAGKTVVNKV